LCGRQPLHPDFLEKARPVQAPFATLSYAGESALRCVSPDSFSRAWTRTHLSGCHFKRLVSALRNSLVDIPWSKSTGSESYVPRLIELGIACFGHDRPFLIPDSNVSSASKTLLALTSPSNHSMWKLLVFLFELVDESMHTTAPPPTNKHHFLPLVLLRHTLIECLYMALYVRESHGRSMDLRS
jgi:hypothetical protein